MGALTIPEVNVGALIEGRTRLCFPMYADVWWVKIGWKSGFPRKSWVGGVWLAPLQRW